LYKKIYSFKNINNKFISNYLLNKLWFIILLID
jgi:hypothetical protein